MPMPESVKTNVPAKRLCSVPGCNKYKVKNEMCKAHFNELSISSDLPSPFVVPRVSLISHIQNPSPDPAGMFVDFSGHEDLLDKIGPVCPELNSEIIFLLSKVMAGEVSFKS